MQLSQKDAGEMFTHVEDEGMKTYGPIHCPFTQATRVYESNMA